MYKEIANLSLLPDFQNDGAFIIVSDYPGAVPGLFTNE